MTFIDTATTAKLDDVARLISDDPQGMLAIVSRSGAQLREALAITRACDLSAVREGGRPRAVVVAGMGGSGIAGHVLQAVAGNSCSVPVNRVRGWTLPAWVGQQDLVMLVSSSGMTGETLACFAEARRRGCRLVVVAAAGSSLALAGQSAGALVVSTPGPNPPRTNIWALSVPLVHVLHELGVLDVPAWVFASTAKLLDDIALRCAIEIPTAQNPAKQLAADLVGYLPMIWGSTELGGIAAYRVMCQLAENAKLPAVNGVLPEALHNQIVTFEGAESAGLPLRLLMLVDPDEHPRVRRAREAAVAVAAERGVEMSEVWADPGHPLERLAHLVGLTDLATVYVALAMGVNPTPITPIDQLKRATV